MLLLIGLAHFYSQAVLFRIPLLFVNMDREMLGPDKKPYIKYACRVVKKFLSVNKQTGRT